MAGVFASMAIKWAIQKLACMVSTPMPSSSSAAPAASEDLEVLKRLERTMHRIHATLHDAEEHWNIREETAKLRLKELKKVAYDAEDVVDEYDYEMARHKVEAFEQSARANRSGKRRHEEVDGTIQAISDIVPVPSELATRARKIMDMFNEIKDYSSNFSLSENDGVRRSIPDIHQVRQTSSMVFEPSIIGRESIKDTVIEKMLSQNKSSTPESHVSVLAIVGMPGVGKTTLAQLVYNNTEVCKSFDVRVWVCVSENFDVNNITKRIISATNEFPHGETIANLQEELVKEIQGKRFLLVLDDVWNEQRDYWEMFRLPMLKTKLCKIIVTTRHKNVARLVQTMDSCELSCLDPNDSWSLFKQTALLDEEHPNNPSLHEIGKDIVSKCKGLPLAIKTIGSMLRYEPDETIWKDILESDLWDLEQSQNEVLPALELSYKQMPMYLKRCFIALSLFPKDYILYEENVVLLWEPLELLQHGGGADKAKLAVSYLHELAQRSIIEISTHNSLKAIIVIGHGLGEIVIPDDIFLKFKRLCVFSLNGAAPTNLLPDSVGNLKLLRFLRFRCSIDCQIMQLPKSVFQLFNLHTLEVMKPAFDLYTPIVSGIGRLIKLETLPPLEILSGYDSNLSELRNMRKVRSLSLKGLDYVCSVEDAMEADIPSKIHLQSLNLDFTSSHHQQLQQHKPGAVSHKELLESLQPCHTLRDLSIYGYRGLSFPCWVGNTSFSKLTKVVLSKCEWECLPALGELPSLESLEISRMYNLRFIGREFCCLNQSVKVFRSLVNLSFSWMYELSEWSGVKDVPVSYALCDLYINDCASLIELPSLPSLIKLKISNCSSLGATIPMFPALQYLSIKDCASLLELPTLPSLMELNISNCSGLGAIIPMSPTLCELSINKCASLLELPMMESLWKLEISHCPSLRAVGLFPELSVLELSGPFKIEVLDSCLSLNSPLEHLEIDSSPVVSIPLRPQYLTSLATLRLSFCSDLQYCDGLVSLTSLRELNMAGVFASMAIEWAIDKLYSLLPACLVSTPASSSSSAAPAESEDLEVLKRLERTMHRIHATLHDAEEQWNIREETAKLRLKELKKVAYDAEDVVDEYGYEMTRHKVEAFEQSARANRSGKRRREEVDGTIQNISDIVPVPSELATRARKIMDMFNEIKDYASKFSLSENDGVRRSIPDMHQVRQTSSMVFEQSIIGRGSIKDTVIEKMLSQNKSSTPESHVSVLGIVGMPGVGKTTLAQLVYNNTEEELVKEIQDKRFLLVLDDVWNERRDYWEMFRLPMLTTKLCKIIVTTRSQNVARLVQTMDSCELSCLDSNDSWSLFKQTALLDEEHANNPSLQEIGKDIVSRCKGLPLAIKTIGSMLRYEPDETKWKDILESDLWDLEQSQNEITYFMKKMWFFCGSHWSYFNMITYFMKKMWFVCGSHWSYFNMVMEQIRQNLQTEDSLKAIIVIGHGLDEIVIPDDIFLKFKRLRVFSLNGAAPTNLLPDSAGNLKLLRFLRWRCSIDCQIMQLPKSLETLPPLEILSGYDSNLSELRNIRKVRSLSLKGLDYVCSVEDAMEADIPMLSKCEWECLPALGELPSLESLEISRMYNLRFIGREFCCLNQSVKVFRSLVNLSFSWMYELSEWSGVKDDAMEADIPSKIHLQSLNLDFTSSHHQQLQQHKPGAVSHKELLESLQPCHTLRDLSIYGYRGLSFPCWVGNTSFSKLTKVVLSKCEWECLPALGELPSLESLEISRMYNLRFIGREFCCLNQSVKVFRSLVNLSFSWMYELSEWSGVKDGDFACLETLLLCQDNKLRFLPLVPFSSLSPSCKFAQMATPIASMAVKWVLDKLSSLMVPERLTPVASSSSSSISQGMKDLQVLERTMHRIHATLVDAEEHWNIHEEITAKLRLKELKELAYGAQDVVEEYEYEVNRCRPEDPDRCACNGSNKRMRHQEVVLPADYWMGESRGTEGEDSRTAGEAVAQCSPEGEGRQMRDAGRAAGAGGRGRVRAPMRVGEAGGGLGATIPMFPSLQYLSIKNCASLLELPTLLSLMELNISNC
uniref:AAA+ ATPase domain-containing protein n=1 Tax=Oryza rufipogon TaxID=4529 RepID=A0A0E0R8L8_ORYRU